jgi:hypothetical protein
MVAIFNMKEDQDEADTINVEEIEEMAKALLDLRPEHQIQ